ncbi:MAG TPA: VWA domain-containing protein [Solirubrobacteraceae bacterium]|nr:VWA domain-containing protein [Solirubrobacteraceae bacterium]
MLQGRRLAGTGFVLASLLLTAPGAAHAASANLPGGTSITAGIDAPADGALIASPPGDVSLGGTASVGTGVPVANTTLVYVVDTSGSTGNGGGCGGDQNSDGANNTILDCEIAAGRALNQQAITAGTVGQVGVVFFESTASIRDVGPVAAGTQGLTGPATDANSSGTPDVEEVLRSADDGGNTNFEDAVRKACALVQQSTNPNNLVVFLSDGTATIGGNALDDLPCSPRPATFQTFAVGSGSSCSDTGGGRGSLAQIAVATGGACTPVSNVASLPGVIPGVIQSQLTRLELSIDGGAPQDISASATPGLPQTGPATVDYDTTVPGLAPRKHTLCVTAFGSDGGGPGSVQECHDVVVATIELAPSAATGELGTPGQTHTVTATVAAGADGGVGGVGVSFSIASGPNAGATGAATTNAAGEATFTYAAAQGLAGLGTDTISGCFTDSQTTTACDTATMRWVDTTAPAVACSPTTNPSGKTIPAAGNNPKAGQNPDGFYVLTATDAVDPNPAITLADSGSAATFGPFASGTTTKLTQARGATPSMKPGAGVIAHHITIKGDGSVTATDASGNTSAPVSCKVPPFPK